MREEIRTLDMSDGAEETSEVKFTVPEPEGHGEIPYVVTVSKKIFYASLTSGSLKKFMEDVEKNVLKDFNKGKGKNDKN